MNIKKIQIIFFSLTMIIFFNKCKQKNNWVDLTHTFNDSTIYWPNDPSNFKHIVNFWQQTPKGFFYASCSFAAPEHGGTHIDAPIHFAKDHWTVDQIPIQSLTGEGIIVDVSENALKNKDYQISINDFLNYENKYGQLEENSIIIFKTGYGQFYPSRSNCLGTDSLGEKALPLLHFPGIEPALASWLVKNRKPKLIGIDTPSIDFGQSSLFETHQIFLGNNIPGLENVANLDAIHTNKINIIALPFKIGKGSGGPVRIIAQEL